MATDNDSGAVIEQVFESIKSSVNAFGVGNVLIFIHRYVVVDAKEYLFTFQVNVANIFLIHQKTSPNLAFSL